MPNNLIIHNKQAAGFPGIGKPAYGEAVYDTTFDCHAVGVGGNTGCKVVADVSSQFPDKTHVPQNRSVDVAWLKAAATTYHISPDINNYVISQVPIITVDIPNRNLQAFPFDEVVFFDPILGRQIYKTFIGKPVHYNHKNEDPTAAKGVIFDSYLLKIPKYNLYKIVLLTGVDKTKDQDIASRLIENKKGGPRVGWSFGSLVNNFVCSVCGTVVNEKKTYCACFAKGKGSILDGKLVYELCYSSNFIEVSVVDTPADATAWGDAL